MALWLAWVGYQRWLIADNVWVSLATPNGGALKLCSLIGLVQFALNLRVRRSSLSHSLGQAEGEHML